MLTRNRKCPPPARRDVSVAIDARPYEKEDGTTDPGNDASPRDTMRAHSANLDGRSPTPHSPAQNKGNFMEMSGINKLCLDSIQMLNLRDVSSQNGHAALPAAYVDKTRKEADATRIDSYRAPVTSRGSLQNSDSMGIDQIPMASGDWQVGSGVDASRDIQSNNLSLRAGTPDPVVSRTSNQLNNEDFSLGIDLDMGLPLLTEEEQLKQNHLLSIGLDIHTIGGVEQSSNVQDAHTQFDVLPEPPDGHISLWKRRWDAQSAKAPEHADCFSSQVDCSQDVSLFIDLSGMAIEEHLQSEINDPCGNVYVFEDWTLVEKDDAGAGRNRE